jgi:endonuclease III
LPGISHSGRKAQYLIAWARYLVGRRGDIEPAIEALRRVHGIGRKSAALILYGTKGIDAGMPLDTHALRVLERLGWFPPARNPAVREKQLLAVVTEGHRNRLFLALTHHGRQPAVATPRVQCPADPPAECHAVHQNLSAKPAAPT